MQAKHLLETSFAAHGMDHWRKFDHVVASGFIAGRFAIRETPGTLANRSHVGAVLLVGGLLADSDAAGKFAILGFMGSSACRLHRPPSQHQ